MSNVRRTMLFQLPNDLPWWFDENFKATLIDFISLPERDCDIKGCARCFPDDNSQCMACQSNFVLSKEFQCIGKWG